MRALHEPFYNYAWSTSFNGFSRVLPVTGWAAVRVWTFWGLATAILSLMILHIDPGLESGDALLGGAAGTWIFAYVAGNLLGPIGAFRPATIWLMVFAAIGWLWRNPPVIVLRAPSTGQKLALLACVLMAIGSLPLQLGSPIPPYMDVLSIPASAQRIVTFGRYLPFDSDPYGYWTPLAQTPGLELFYALLAIGSFTKLAVVAEMAALVPMSCLIIFATYRLGRSLMGDAAGGMASMLLFAATLLSRAQTMRGTAVAFALVALGLAFFIDPDRRPIKTALAGLALGTAIASHAIIGGLAIATAFSTLFVELLRGDGEDAFAKAVCLLGALLIAVPEFAVGLGAKLPYPILPFSQLSGIGIVCLAARLPPARLRDGATFGKWVPAALIAMMLVLLVWRPGPLVMLGGLLDAFPMLLVMAVSGLMIVFCERNHSNQLWTIATALLGAGFVEYCARTNLFASGGTAQAFGFDDVVNKIGEYWYPYLLIFPAAAGFDWLFRCCSKPLALMALLAFLMFPWLQRPDLDVGYMQHSIAQQWAVDWLIAKQGWWGDTPDTRWAQSPPELALNEKLRDEILAGRITTATHIVHVTSHTIMWQDVLLFSVYTGIDDDLYVVKPAAGLGQGGTAGGRLRPVSMLPAAIAKFPAYVVVHNDPPPELSLPLNGYDQIFNEGRIRLYRRHDLTPRAVASEAHG